MWHQRMDQHISIDFSWLIDLIDRIWWSYRQKKSSYRSALADINNISSYYINYCMAKKQNLKNEKKWHVKFKYTKCTLKLVIIRQKCFSLMQNVLELSIPSKKNEKKNIFFWAPGGLPGSTPHPPFKNQKSEIQKSPRCRKINCHEGYTAQITGLYDHHFLFCPRKIWSRF